MGKLIPISDTSTIPTDNKIKEIEYTKKGAVDKISEYKIQNGHRVEKAVYDSRKNLLLKKTYQYLYY